MLAEAIYKGATRPAMKLGIPLVPLVVLFGIGMLLILWGGTPAELVDRRRWCSLRSSRRWLWMRFVTSEDDQRFRQMFVAAKLRLRDRNRRFWQRAQLRALPLPGSPRCLASLAPERRDARAGRIGHPVHRPRHWARARAENPLARFVPFSSLVSPHDVITRGGDYLRVWRLDGVPFECADEHLIAERHEAKCSLLRNLAGGQFAVWEHRLHRGDRRRDCATRPSRASRATCRSAYYARPRASAA